MRRIPIRIHSARAACAQRASLARIPGGCSRGFRSAALLALCAALASAQVVTVIPGFNAAYAAGKIGGGSSPAPRSYVPIPPNTEYYLDYQVYFESDWEWVKGGKLPGLVGGTHTSGCNAIDPNGWSARFMWRSGGRGELYLYHQNRRSGCGDQTAFAGNRAFAKNRWNRITERVVLNAPGQANGLIEAWLDGAKVVTVSNVRLRGNVAASTALVDQVSLQTFYGGSDNSWAPPHTTHARFSQFIVRRDLPDFTKPFPGDAVAIVPIARRQVAGNSEAVDVLGRFLRARGPTTLVPLETPRRSE